MNLKREIIAPNLDRHKVRYVQPRLKVESLEFLRES